MAKQIFLSLLLIFSFFNFKNLNAIENKILFKVDNYIITSLDIKKEVAGLIQNELLAFLSEAQSLISTKDYEGLHFRVHKLTSKFSFLAMPEAFDLSQEIGGELREGRLTDRSICKLLSYAQTALSLLTAKTKSYESHNN